MKNHLGERTLQTYEAWRRALKRECPSVRFEGNRDICQAFGTWCGVEHGIGEWDGASGTITYPRGGAK